MCSEVGWTCVTFGKRGKEGGGGAGCAPRRLRSSKVGRSVWPVGAICSRTRRHRRSRISCSKRRRYVIELAKGKKKGSNAPVH